MTISVLICHPDGSQSLETREVPEDYFSDQEEPAAPEE